MTQPVPPEALVDAASKWWSTAIVDIHPGEIKIRGYPIEDLIGEISFAEMIWLMLRGDLPARDQGALLEAALVAAVDHGPQAPSIAISRMAITCGAPINGAMASAINTLDDIHGGAGQQCMELLEEIIASSGAEDGIGRATVESVLDHFTSRHGQIDLIDCAHAVEFFCERSGENCVRDYSHFRNITTKITKLIIYAEHLANFAQKGG